MSMERLEPLLDSIADQQFPDQTPFNSGARITESAFYDFAEHRYLMDPEFVTHSPEPISSKVRPTIIDAVDVSMHDHYSSIYATMRDAGLNITYHTAASMADMLIDSELFSQVIDELEQALTIMPDAESDDGKKLIEEIGKGFRAYLDSQNHWSDHDIEQQLVSKLTDPKHAKKIAGKIYRGYVAKQGLPVNITPFRPGSINFGLQPVYRQVWTPLGVQKGEIVRTLPLGPGQKEKVTFRVLQRSKTSSSRELSTSTETTTQSSDTTKDSTEVVAEAARSKQYSVSAEASFSFGPVGGGSVSASMGGDSSESSRNAKTQLNESMVQSSSRIRRDTKVVVSTESEQTSEMTTASEIANNNDEIAVTYVYSKLQRQYEISTYLAELNTVVYVAERIPDKWELTREWFRQHAQELRAALLDPAFDGDLQTVAWSSEIDEATIDPNILKGFKAQGSSRLDYSQAAGTPPDQLAPMAQTYERELQRSRERAEQQRNYKASLERLQAHVHQNILHYCRAIWMAEDPDMRALRFRNVKIPTRWNKQHLDAGYVPPVAVEPDYRNPVSLSEMIDPTGPIGFSGNYAVYRLRQRDQWSDLLDFIDLMRVPYLKVVWSVHSESERLASVYDVLVSLAPSVMDEQDLLVHYNDRRLVVDRKRGSGLERLTEAPMDPAGGTISAGDEFRLTVRTMEGAALEEGDKFEVRVRLVPMLEDPELKYLRWEEPLPGPEIEALVYTPDVLERMGALMPELGDVLDDDPTWEELSEQERQMVRANYHEYLMHEDHTRRLLLDTNNLVLTRIVDPDTSLEPFKSAHRYIDALKAAEELKQAGLETTRLSERIADRQLGDPDTEKVVVIDSDKVDPSVDPD